MKKYRLFLFGVFIILAALNIYVYRDYYKNQLPDEINVYSLNNINIPGSRFLSIELLDNNLQVSNTENNAGANEKINNEINNGINNGTNIPTRKGKYTASAKLFGIINIKNISVNVIEKQKIIPSGQQIGIYLQTNGVMVIGTGEVTTLDGTKINPSENIIFPGDYITEINDEIVCSKSQLLFLINKYGDKDITLKIKRNEDEIKVKLTPVKSDKSNYMLGIWVRDDSQGIGTLTYITENNEFGALGHGISDVDTKKLLSSENGVLYKANIWGINKGENGNPGGILGSIIYEKHNEIGKITKNTNCGIFGIANEKLLSEYINQSNAKPMEIGLKQEVETGDAFLRTCLNGECKDYKIKIKKVNYNKRNVGKSLELEISDEELLALTNGIIQGMSGSPIIQNDKIIGAVTHVFVNDSKKGYGIFIEDMLSQ